jgi:5-methylcytosine-specific restriction endonuclease McrA
MIHRVADTVQVSYHCVWVGNDFVYSMKFIYGQKHLSTEQRPLPRELDGIRGLAQSWMDALIAQDALRNKRHLAELGPYVPDGMEQLEARLRRTRELDDQQSASLREGEVRIEAARKTLERQMEKIPLETPRTFKCNGRHYALHQGSLWSSGRGFTVEQWLGLISQAINREEARLATLTALNEKPGDRRSAIPASVRIEVWRRDQGRCARCGSQERLEFDHIIPVSLGGSNSARNIELLCETAIDQNLLRSSKPKLLKRARWPMPRLVS